MDFPNQRMDLLSPAPSHDDLSGASEKEVESHQHVCVRRGLTFEVIPEYPKSSLRLLPFVITTGELPDSVEIQRRHRIPRRSRAVIALLYLGRQLVPFLLHE